MNDGVDQFRRGHGHSLANNIWALEAGAGGALIHGRLHGNLDEFRDAAARARRMTNLCPGNRVLYNI